MWKIDCGSTDRAILRCEWGTVGKDSLVPLSKSKDGRDLHVAIGWRWYSRSQYPMAPIEHCYGWSRASLIRVDNRRKHCIWTWEYLTGGYYQCCYCREYSPFHSEIARGKRSNSFVHPRAMRVSNRDTIQEWVRKVADCQAVRSNVLLLREQSFVGLKYSCSTKQQALWIHKMNRFVLFFFLQWSGPVIHRLFKRHSNELRVWIPLEQS
jgi:hypothetical protein